MRDEKSGRNLSLKLTQLGLKLDGRECLLLTDRIVRRGRELVTAVDQLVRVSVSHAAAGAEAIPASRIE